MTKSLSEHKLNEPFNGFLLIKKAIKGTASNQSPFLSLTLADKSGDIEAKLWNVSNTDIEIYVQGEIVHVKGSVGEYMGKAQVQIQELRLPFSDETITTEDLIETAPIDRDVLESKIRDTVASITEIDIQRIVHGFVSKYDEDLFVYPAASGMHHAYMSGLAHHISGMLDLGEAMCKIHPMINRDLLLAGIILHDIGKIHEYESVTKPVFTLKGSLLGHISIMMAELEEMAKDLQIDSEVVILLQHMVLAHHGKGEWGSPKKPVTLEAEVLHNIDMLDANMNALGKALRKTETGEFTERVYPLDNRSFYKHNLSLI